MVRLLVSLLHAGLGLLLGTSALWMLAQARLNALWEAGFYSTMTEPTLVITIGALLLLCAAGGELLGGLGYALGQRWGGHLLLLLSTMDAVVLPAPLSWLFWAMVVAIAVDLWLHPPAVSE